MELTPAVKEALERAAIALRDAAEAWTEHDQAAFDNHDGIRRAFSESFEEAVVDILSFTGGV